MTPKTKASIVIIIFLIPAILGMLDNHLLLFYPIAAFVIAFISLLYFGYKIFVEFFEERS